MDSVPGAQALQVPGCGQGRGRTSPAPGPRAAWHRAGVPEKEKEQGWFLGCWGRTAPHSTLGGVRVQGASTWLGPKSCVSEQAHEPPPTSAWAVHPSRRPPFLWMWSLALVNPMTQWLSRSQIGAPVQADKGCVLVLQCGVCGNRSQVVPGPDPGQPSQKAVKWQGVLAGRLRCHLRRPERARADLSGLDGTCVNQAHSPYTTRSFQNHFQM